jgi:hypothetical protein
LVIAVGLSPEFEFNLRVLIALPLIALSSTVIEAITPHGWDNTPMQVVPTMLAALLLLN